MDYGIWIDRRGIRYLWSDIGNEDVRVDEELLQLTGSAREWGTLAFLQSINERYGRREGGIQYLLRFEV